MMCVGGVRTLSKRQLGGVSSPFGIEDFSRFYLLGTVGGLLLGLFTHGHVAVLQHIPTAAEITRKAQEQMAKMPDLKESYAVVLA